ncbi:hypothetical protein FQA39_LY18308 [Lamprigera yunnana]|nr:hypothetical protein FQA39_LY18308 [Lamprigera yunnana]
MCELWQTKVLGLKFGEQLVVAVCSYSTIKKIFENKTFNARPKNFFGKLRTIGKEPGITCAEGRVWVNQRQFIVRHLRDIGLGKEIMETKISEKLEDTVDEITKNCEAVEVGKLLQHAVINLIWFLTAGTCIEKNDLQFLRLLNLLERRSKVFDMSGGLLSQFPWLRFIVPEKIGYNLIINLNAELKQFLMQTIDEHHRNWTEGNESDLMYSFISKMKESDSSLRFTNDQLLMICLDLFVAGAHSTSNSLDYTFLMMLMHSDVQKKVQAELDSNFDVGHKFKYKDRHKVPYVQAVLLEVQRYCSVVPIASRRAFEDTTLEDYYIPKDTTVLINLHAVLMSKEIWGDPQVFRPERFLDEKGQLTVTEQFLPFSMGRRRCLGEAFAKAFLFMFFTEILQQFTISLVKSTDAPELTPSQGILSFPQKYLAKFSRRLVKN